MGSILFTASTTSILNLSDVCLLAVFQYLNVQDLSTVADVCSRFRAVAKTSFDQSKRSRLEFPDDFEYSHVSETLLKIPGVLRNFGSYITEIRVSSWGMRERLRSRYESELVDLLTKYCCGTLITLELFNFKLKPENVLKLRPVFEGLQKLELHCETFPKLSKSWFPKLRELKYYDSGERDFYKEYSKLVQSYYKLEKIALIKLYGITDDDIQNILKCNPKLKEIELCRCKFLSAITLRAIAEQAPEIEKLDLKLKFNEHLNRYTNYFSGMPNLTSLVLNLEFPDPHYVSLVCEISEARMPLKYFRVHNQRMKEDRDAARSFIDAILALNKLETLILVDFDGLNAKDINRFCKHLKHLTVLYLEDVVPLTVDEILKLVGNAKKLEQLVLDEKHADNIIDFDGETLMEKTAKIVEKRRNKTHLEIDLIGKCYNVGRLNDSSKLHNNSVSVIKDDSFKGYRDLC